MFDSSDEALKYIADHDIAMVDLKVATIPGKWLHITIPARSFRQEHFEDGVGYDGSSGAGFSTVENGDVVAKPEPDTAFLDPFWERPTLSFICATATADTKEPFASDPRTIAHRAVASMQSGGLADQALMAPEFEFHVLDRLEVVNEPYSTGVHIEASEVQTDGTSVRIAPRGGYMAAPPMDKLHDMRSEIALILEQMGVAIRYHHHEVGAPGQCEIEVALTPLVKAADQAMLVKYVVKNVAQRHGKLATFMPKPIFGEAGNGMHVHQKLQKEGKSLFFDHNQQNYANLSAEALSYVGGLLQHGCALTGLTNPSTNSFKRLVPGFEAPVNLFFSLANRSAAVRVPRYAVAPEEKRIEYRPPDFTGNVYLSLAAMLMAGLDGIRSKLDVGAAGFGPFDVDMCRQDDAFRAKIAPLPASLEEAVRALKDDHAFLVKDEVFPESFIDAWIAAKQQREVSELSRRPHPYEYQLYLDA